MNFRIGHFLFVLFYREQLKVEGSRPLTAVNNSAHASTLFLDLRNDEGPTKKDPAFADRRTRKRICQEITNSGFFDQHNLEPVVMNDVLEQLMRQHPTIFRRIYAPRTTMNVVKQTNRPFKYNNSFAPMEFDVEKFVDGELNYIRITEHVIVCVLKYQTSNNLVARYVTKEYNVFGDPYLLEDPYKAGRFVLKSEEICESHARTMFDSICLAEEPAMRDKKLDSDVKLELRYLTIRKYREPAADDEADPFCRLLRGIYYWKNQHYRFCVAIFKSPDFAGKYAYPRQNSIREHGCKEVEVSFKTLEARQIAFGQTYIERMAECRSRSLQSGESVSFYISRAYMAKRLFIYQRKADSEVYLEHLSTDIAIVDVPSHAFEDVED